ncbi:ABC transporter ATP-binding protein [Alkaliphilus peptidifermentans]|uniref:ABC-2 type transport system ATP-binding protein n=1 Tax=Alkaliphilus peptidifermentans DSM 18978 TaxID=1120976 RepID=A0A1G5JZC6_9FIRM|nr:ABC transporter ATP-binding protein [Alkaliphilus peptidifermentans]SCY93676.1 ABC-2 type transport system ATP-binding protein [Alkaliphilus peptidifermentans DSM 18978]
MTYIQLNNVIKRYSHQLAVDQVSFTIEKGEVFGLLGPNGAGKSTTIKMLVGLLKPDSGEILVDGIDVKKRPIDVKKKLGLVPQELAIYNNLSAEENIAFFGGLHGLRGKHLKERIEEALTFTGLEDRKKDKPVKFSGGMKRRLNIACAIVHKPDIIIMDEPTVGIDPQSRNHILDSILELNRMGATIIYTSHYMEEVEAICKRVGIMDNGKLIALGDKNHLKKEITSGEKILVETAEVNASAVDALKKLHGILGVSVKDNQIEVYSKSSQERLQDILFILANHQIMIKNIALTDVNLENVFLHLTGKSLRD